MKKFWKKYKVIVILAIAVAAFIGLSFLSESKAPTLESSNQNVSEWSAAVDGDKYVITVIALSYCSACKEYNPIITALAEEYSIPIYWFEIDTLNQEDATIVSSKYAFTEYEGASPYTVITKKGEVISQYAQGYMNKENTLSFLKNSGAVK